MKWYVKNISKILSALGKNDIWLKEHFEYEKAKINKRNRSDKG